MRVRSSIFAAMVLITAAPAIADPVAVTTPAAPNNGAVTIVYKYTPNQDLKYSMTSTTTGTIEMGGRSMPMTQTMNADYHMFTKSVDANGDGTLQMAFENITMNMNLNGQTVQVPTAQLQSAMSGFTMTMSPQGKLIAITGANGSPAAAALNNMMNPSQLGNLALLPSHAVNIGDSWRGSMDLASLGAQAYLRMTLNGVSVLTGSHVANIGVKMFMTFAPKIAAASVPNPPQMQGTMNGLGTMGFDVDNGYQTTFDEKMAMTMNILPPVNASPNTRPMNGNIQLNIDTNMKLVSADILPAGTSPIPTPTPAPAGVTQ